MSVNTAYDWGRWNKVPPAHWAPPPPYRAGPVVLPQAPAPGVAPAVLPQLPPHRVELTVLLLCTAAGLPPGLASLLLAVLRGEGGALGVALDALEETGKEVAHLRRLRP